MNRIGEQYYRKEPTLAGRFRKVNNVKPFKNNRHFYYVPSERKRGLDALSEAKGHTIDLTIIATSCSEEQGLVPCSEFMDLKILVCQLRGMGACPPFRVHGLA